MLPAWTMPRLFRYPGSVELADITARLLGQLPSWFGIPESNAEYVESATRLPGLVARTDTADTEAIGVLLHRRHFVEAAEIHLMAVAPSWHRRGVGRALVNVLASNVSTDGCQMLLAFSPWRRPQISGRATLA
jgi:GNAT superfamily N-acetyltransferase